MGWLTGWSYRKTPTVTAQTGAGTNYQIPVTIHKAAGSDSGVNVYVGSNCRDDFGDIRFTAADGTTLIDYWMDNYGFVSGSVANFWVEVSADLSTVNATPYLYYGNPSATTTSNGANTFLFFDDFSGDLSKWSVVSGTWAVVSGELRYTTGTSEQYIKTASYTIGDGVVEYKLRMSVKTQACFGGVLPRYQDTSNFYRQVAYYTGDSPNLGMMCSKRQTGADSNTFTGWSWAKDTNYYMRAKLLGNSQKYYSTDYNTNETARTDSAWASGALALEGVSTSESGYIYFDDVRVRKYVSPEPAISSWGAEETASSVLIPVIMYNRKMQGMS